MSINKLSHNAYEVYFNGCGYSFEITRDTGVWVINGPTGKVAGPFRTVSQAITALEELSHA